VYVGDGLRVRTRTSRQVTDSLPELTGLIDALDGHRVILVGESVACVDGRVDFYRLVPRTMHTGRMARWAATQVPVTFVAYDLLHLDGMSPGWRWWSANGCSTNFSWWDQPG
jgi:bifunctional non-homologous end joining protein LigD